MNQTNDMNPQNRTATTIEDIDIKELLLKLIRKWYVLVITGIICLSFALYYIFSTPPQYATKGTILVRSENNGLGKLASSDMNIAADMFKIAKAVDDELIVIHSNTIISNLVKELSLQTSIFYKKRLGGKYELFNNEPLVVIYPDGFLNTIRGSMNIEVQKTGKGIWKFKFTHKLGFDKTKHKTETSDLSKAVQTPWGDFLFIENPQHIDPKYPNYNLIYTITSHKVRVEQYSEQIITALSNKKANAITISYVGGNTSKNEAIVNKIIELYTRDASQDKTKASIQMTAFISERIDILSKELMEIETKVEDFRIKNNIANLNEQSNIALRAITDYDKVLTEIDMQYSLMNFIEDYITKADQLDLIPSNTGINNESLSNLIIVYNNQLLELRRLTRSTNEANPVVSQLRNKIMLQRGMILETITNIKDGFRIRRQDIISKTQELEKNINNVPSVERQYFEIGREQTIKRQLYLYLLQKREEAQLSLSSVTSENKIVDQAYTAVKAVSPRTMIALAFAFVFAVALYGGYVFLYYTINNTIESKKALRSLTKLPIIGTIPSVRNSSSNIIMNTNEHTSAAEQFRLVRSNLKFILKNPDDKVLVITSSRSGEGKSFFSSNLAISLALIDKKVALVGLDIRRPTLHQYLNIHSHPGVTNYLSDKDTKPEEIYQKYNANPNLDIYVAGPIPPNPSELLNTDRLPALVEYLRANYDYVLLDTAPVAMVSDTFLITPLADAVLYVCRQNVTTNDQIRYLNELTETERLNNVYLILNDTSESGVYGYGYGYGYSRNKQK